MAVSINILGPMLGVLIIRSRPLLGLYSAPDFGKLPHASLTEELGLKTISIRPSALQVVNVWSLTGEGPYMTKAASLQGLPSTLQFLALHRLVLATCKHAGQWTNNKSKPQDMKSTIAIAASERNLPGKMPGPSCSELPLASDALN